MTTDTTPLAPCPFCGAPAHGYAIEPHSHSPSLMRLIPELPDHPGSYVIEGQCACGSGLIGADETEVVARWNRRAPQPSPAAQGDAELGRTAMRFVDRAGDVHPGIDDAETICAEFYKAMSDVIEKMPHVQRMQPSMSAPASQEVKSHDN